MLNPRGAGFSDRPPEIFEYGHHRHNDYARAFEPFIAMGLSDEEAFEALFDDAFRLDSARCTYGKQLNKPRGKARRKEAA